MPSLRFYVTNLLGGRISLSDDESRHARKVLRVQPGDAVELFDGLGQEADGRVVEAGRVIAIEVGALRNAAPLRPRIEVAVALPKGDRAAVLVEKASELGADRLIPMITERSVVDPGGGKLDRLRRIAIESAKQCGRSWLMEIAEPVAFDRVLVGPGDAVKLFADAHSGNEDHYSQILTNLRMHSADVDRLLVLVGPEGGWTNAERQAAQQAGFHPWRLGPYVMRIETAALAAVAILRSGA